MVKEQLANQAHCFFIQEAALTEALGVVRKVEEAANKRLHDEVQKYTTLLAKVVSLHAEIAELKDAAAATQVKMANLETRSATQEVYLGKVEADLAEKNEALEKIKVELVEQVKLLKESQEELAGKAEALVNTKKEMAAQAEHSKKIKKELLDDARMPTPRGSKMLCLRLSVNTLRWIPRTLPLPTMSSKEKSC